MVWTKTANNSSDEFALSKRSVIQLKSTAPSADHVYKYLDIQLHGTKAASKTTYAGEGDEAISVTTKTVRTTSTSRILFLLQRAKWFTITAKLASDSRKSPG